MKKLIYLISEKWVNLESIMKSEIGQAQEENCQIILSYLPSREDKRKNMKTEAERDLKMKGNKA